MTEDITTRRPNNTRFQPHDLTAFLHHSGTGSDARTQQYAGTGTGNGEIAVSGAEICGTPRSREGVGCGSVFGWPADGTHWFGAVLHRLPSSKNPLFYRLKRCPHRHASIQEAFQVAEDEHRPGCRHRAEDRSCTPSAPAPMD